MIDIPGPEVKGIDMLPLRVKVFTTSTPLYYDHFVVCAKVRVSCTSYLTERKGRRKVRRTSGPPG